MKDYFSFGKVQNRCFCLVGCPARKDSGIMLPASVALPF